MKQLLHKITRCVSEGFDPGAVGESRPSLTRRVSQSRSQLCVLGLGLALFLIASVTTADDEPFRPEAGKFPPVEKAHSYRGELVFVDHANRRGSIRVAGTGKFYRNDPQPFAMLPYGVIRYHGAPADLRDIPLGTVMHVRAFLPACPQAFLCAGVAGQQQGERRGALSWHRYRTGREPRAPLRRRAQSLPARGSGLAT